MALFQELLGQGRVVGGHLSNGAVHLGGATGFSKHGDLTIQHPSNPFKRHRINAETVRQWEELDTKDGVAGAIGQAAAKAALPGIVGKSLGAGLGAAMNMGHTVRLNWADGKESIIELPQKQYMVLSVMLSDRQIVPERPQNPEPSAQASARGALLARASTAFGRGMQSSPAPEPAPVQDVTEQIARLAALHAEGILTNAEFAAKKAELLSRL
ncbi:SHOCT domain-containing protein [Aeromicrobium sp. 179-A 4D2 NHS]|uniref:SHOCT domain-containing protein n=1 Tax=Aeromicrobium sp. 179-A 4D2 NHS TaxID=3142375 RepID=UPI0039A39DFD